MMNKLLNAVLLATITLFMLSSCGRADGGKVTARDVLKQNKNADIIQYDSRVFSNVTNLEWFEDRKEKISFSKDYYVGEIQKQSNSSLLFTDFSATKLPKGTKIYALDEKDGGMLFVYYKGEELYYMELLEG
ncbi:hypothetical protein [Bacillus sp. FJAT-45066]|uniref:hypothetical protein n=1 Tax=Bacillus sp. FJAT-45066 TaxID=2011010 RepID=UPI0011447E1E|nr:hypothetical protein [Bacillus sp. FJAT-45066]